MLFFRIRVYSLAKQISVRHSKVMLFYPDDTAKIDWPPHSDLRAVVWNG